MLRVISLQKGFTPLHSFNLWRLILFQMIYAAVQRSNAASVLGWCGLDLPPHPPIIVFIFYLLNKFIFNTHHNIVMSLQYFCPLGDCTDIQGPIAWDRYIITTPCLQTRIIGVYVVKTPSTQVWCIIMFTRYFASTSIARLFFLDCGCSFSYSQITICLRVHIRSRGGGGVVISHILL